MGKISMQGIITQNFPFYTFQDVDLKNGDAEISDELDGLLITQPGKDITEKELRRIDQFVMKGKSLAVFASAVNVKANDGTMAATLSTHGLDKLLEGYGVGISQDVVLDRGRCVRVMVPTVGGLAQPEFPQMLEVQDDPRFTGNERLVDTSFPALFRVQDLAVPLASSLVIKTDKQPGAKLQVADALVARGRAPHGRHRRPQAVPEVGREAQGPGPAAVPHRRVGRGHAQDGLPRG